MKKWVLLFLLVSLVMSAIVPVLAEMYNYSPYYGILQTTSDGFVYEVLDNGEAQIAGYTGNKRELTIPSLVDGHLVTSIKQYAFSRLHITKATVPGTINTIYGGAFRYCDDLTTIEIEEGVVALLGSPFYSCANLVNINFPSSLRTILSNPFWNCSSLTTVKLSNAQNRFVLIDGVLYDWYDKKLLWYPMTKHDRTFSVANGTKFIASGAISLSSITELFIPHGVEILEPTAIEFSSTLKVIHIPATVQKMEGAFISLYNLETLDVDSSNTQYETIKGVLFNKTRHSLLLYPSNRKDTSYSVPEGTLMIESEAFQNALILVDLKLPQSLLEIGSEAFTNCRNLKVLRIPDNVTKLGAGFALECVGLEIVHLPDSPVEVYSAPFEWCQSLTTFVLSDNHPTLSLIDGCLVRKKDKTLLCYPAGRTNRSYTVPSGIEIIGGRAFTGTDDLVELHIPEGVTTIQDTLFSINDVARKVWLPASLTKFEVSNSQYQNITFVVIPGTYAENICQNLGLNYEYATASTKNSTAINTNNDTIVVHNSSDPDSFTANWYGYSDDSSLDNTDIDSVVIEGHKYQFGKRWANSESEKYYIYDSKTDSWIEVHPVEVATAAADQEVIGRDADIQTFKGSSYKIYYASDLNIRSWEEARDYCKSLGGHLAIINNAAENQFITDLIEDTGYNRVFIGCYYDTNTRTWKWVDGEKLSNGYTRWSAGEPSDPYNERYGQINQGNGFWNDSKFLGTEYGSYVTWGSAFVCEWD